jgi:hypothetical protein
MSELGRTVGVGYRTYEDKLLSKSSDQYFAAAR